MDVTPEDWPMTDLASMAPLLRQEAPLLLVLLTVLSLAILL